MVLQDQAGVFFIPKSMPKFITTAIIQVSLLALIWRWPMARNLIFPLSKS